MAKEAGQSSIFTCDICNRTFKNLAGLAAHRSFVHGISSSAPAKSTSNTKTIVKDSISPAKRRGRPRLTAVPAVSAKRGPGRPRLQTAAKAQIATVSRRRRRKVRLAPSASVTLQQTRRGKPGRPRKIQNPSTATQTIQPATRFVLHYCPNCGVKLPQL